MDINLIRSKQQAAVQVLAELLAEDLPVADWVISSAYGSIEGQLESQAEVKAWAAAHRAAVVRNYRSDKRYLEATFSVDPEVRVWYPLPSGEAFAEVDA